MTLDRQRLHPVLGWGSVAGGVAMLTLTRPLCRVLRLDGRAAAWMRVLGVRDLVIGAGLLKGRDRRAWHQARTLGDAFDGALLASTLGRQGALRRLPVVMGALALTLFERPADRRRKAEARGPLTVLRSHGIVRTGMGVGFKGSAR